MLFSASHSPGSRLLFFKGSWLRLQHLTGSCSHRASIQTCSVPTNRWMGDAWGEDWGTQHCGNNHGGQGMLGCKREEGSHLIWTAVSRIDVSWMAVSKEQDVLFQERRGLGGKKWVCVWCDTKPPFSSSSYTLCLLLAYSTERTGRYCSNPWHRSQKHTAIRLKHIYMILISK